MICFSSHLYEPRGQSCWRTVCMFSTLAYGKQDRDSYISESAVSLVYLTLNLLLFNWIYSYSSSWRLAQREELAVISNIGLRLSKGTRCFSFLRQPSMPNEKSQARYQGSELVQGRWERETSKPLFRWLGYERSLQLVYLSSTRENPPISWPLCWPATTSWSGHLMKGITNDFPSNTLVPVALQRSLFTSCLQVYYCPLRPAH